MDKKKTEVSEHCHVCEVYTGHEVYPCRICCKAFHKSCLQKLGHCLNAPDVALLHAAKLPIGWTCYLCHDLSNLLTEEELLSLMTSFDRHGIHRDEAVSKAEFLQFSAQSHKYSSKCSLTDEEKTEENFKFSQLDRHQKDYIPWSEFLNYQTVVVLRSRHKMFLVPLLTSREQEIARKVFRLFDENYDGHITPTEAARARSSWCTLFYSPAGSYTGYELFSDNDDDRLKMQLKQRLSFTMATEDEEQASSISWEEFIREQAIYIISTRPNESRIPMMSKEWVQNMQVQFARFQTQRKNSLRPSEFDQDLYENRSDTSGLSSASIEQINILH